MKIVFPPNDIKIEGMGGIVIPPMILIKQKYDDDKIEDLRGHIKQKINRLELKNIEGKSICITAGSRGIPNMNVIYKAVCDCLKELGARPFIIPAMGSHGNASLEGQLEILAGYGLTEKAMEVPIRSTLDVVEYGKLADGTALYCDQYAAKADGIVLMHKVKPHTDYRGEHESGLAKMVAIGIANHAGATSFHKLGFGKFAKCVPEATKVFLDAFPVLCGIGIVQNAYDEVCAIEAALPDDLLKLDARLLTQAKEKIAKFKFDEVDLLIIDQIGKEISGFGADPNVTGRTNGIREDFADVFKAEKLFIAGLTEKTHHNGSGIAMADITTSKCLNDIDWTATWTNIVTSGGIKGGSIPFYLNDDRAAIMLAIRTCTNSDPEKIKIARIKNTLELFKIWVSPALYEQMKKRDDIERISEAQEIGFDDGGFMTGF